MARVEDLIAQVNDPQLRVELSREVKKLKSTKKFGLVFEQHLPETVQVPALPLRIGETVTSRTDGAAGVWRIERMTGAAATLMREGGSERKEARKTDLVVTRRFGEPVYPTLEAIDRIDRGGDKPWHAVIEAENHHALQLLLYTCEGKVDLIYIDPPYNTGARDWKYNNDYIDRTDSWRHSKWLAMMKRRLLLARRLLKPDGVMIVTIDENESATLGLLLRDVFRGYEISPVSIVHNPRGIQGDNFSYCHETAYFLVPKGQRLIANRRIPEDERDGNPLRKWGRESERNTARNCFYPIYFRDGRFDDIGTVPPESFHPKKAWRKLSDGRLEFWPVDNDGVERKWRYSTVSVRSIAEMLSVEERRGEQQVILKKEEGKYKTVWQDPTFDASSNGKRLLTRILPKTATASLYGCGRK